MDIKELYRLFTENSTVCTDTRKLTPGSFFFALKGENFNGNRFAKNALDTGAAYAVIDEKAYGSGKRTILVKNVLRTLQGLATYHRKQLSIPIIALTGSNGKTTTKELTAAVLSQKFDTAFTQGNLNNHIGVPLTLLSMDAKTEIGVVEMGANHFGEIEALCGIALPDYGYITNFGKAHLEGFGSVEGVIKAKTELYRHLKAKGKTVFINAVDPVQVSHTEGMDTFSFGRSPARANVVITNTGSTPFVEARYANASIKSQLTGAYNFHNVAAAIAMGHYFKIDKKSIRTAIERYTPANNRSQLMQKGSNTVLLDAYNANPDSMRAAISNFEAIPASKKVLFLGDMFELGKDSAKEHQGIVNLLEGKGFDRVWLIGKNFSQTRPKDKTIKLLETFEELASLLEGEKPENSHVLIKGSRGMALERVMELL